MSAFDLALQAYRDRRFPEAADHLSRAEPSVDRFALEVLVWTRLGDPERAVAAAERTLALDPDHAPTWINQAAPLRALGLYDRADRGLARALELRPGFAPALLARAQVALDRGEAASALAWAGQAARSGSVEGAEVMAQALLALGRASEAVAAARPAWPRPSARLLTARALFTLGQLDAAARITADLPSEGLYLPALVELRTELARTLRDRGDLTKAIAIVAPGPPALGNLHATLLWAAGLQEAAIVRWRRAVADVPDDGAAWHNLAVALFEGGDPEAAVPAHVRAVSLDPTDPVRLAALAESLGRCARCPEEAAPWLAQALATDGIAHQPLERAVRSILGQNPAVASILADPDHAEPAGFAALDTPLLHLALRKTRLLGPTWERALTALRRRAAGGEVPISTPLAESLAIQAWHTGYAWWVGPGEGPSADPSADPVVQAWYQPPGDGEALPPDLTRIAHVEPAAEAALAAQVPSLGASDDPTSLAVRAQYEEHPYPRLVSVTQKPAIPLRDLLTKILPHTQVVLPVREPGRPLQVLIAGCGTGSQILGARYAQAEITAFDLSRASLGVAARAVAAAGASVRLFHADLLALPIDRVGWRQRFDVVECGGVLHHLADPLAGWRALRACTRPGGLHKIALYSALARQAIDVARAAVADLPRTPAGLREARRRLLDHPDPSVQRTVVWSPDFASLAGFRDLVLHESERRFSTADLAAALTELDLVFLGFQHPDPRTPALYRERYPDEPAQRNLARWGALEQDHPEIFVGMYQFWVQVPR